MEVDPLGFARASMREAFNKTITVLEAGSKRATDLLTSASAWLASTFVALNASLVPLILSYSERTSYPRTSLALAVLGLTAALTLAVLVCYHLSRAGDAYAEVTSSIESIDVEGDLTSLPKINTEPTEKLERQSRRIAVGFTMPPLLFLISVMTFGFGFKFEDTNNLLRCTALQSDMLSASPRRTDGPDLFQALGCKAQGDAMVQFPVEKAKPSIKPRTPALPPQNRTQLL